MLGADVGGPTLGGGVYQRWLRWGWTRYRTRRTSCRWKPRSPGIIGTAASFSGGADSPASDQVVQFIRIDGDVPRSQPVNHDWPAKPANIPQPSNLSKRPKISRNIDRTGFAGRYGYRIARKWTQLLVAAWFHRMMDPEALTLDVRVSLVFQTNPRVAFPGL